MAVTAIAVGRDRGWKILDEGLSITRPLSPVEWRELGRHLADVHNRTQWAIGDWLNAGRGGREIRSADMAYARSITGRSARGLEQLAQVAAAYALEARGLGLPWSFYREALRLPEAERLRSLKVAATNEWTRDDLADFINHRANAAPLLDGTPSTSRSNAGAPRGWTGRRNRNHHEITCPHCGRSFQPAPRRHRRPRV